jgi:aldose 1-epimerase
MLATTLITLSAGDLEASFAPTVGMAGISLVHRGVELLDRRGGLTEYARRGAVMGLPLLHPWANRLDAHEYSLDGRQVRLPAGPPLVHCEEHGLPIHGLLGASPHWKATSTRSTVTAVLDFGSHPALLAAFPFPHQITLDARLDSDGLELSTTVRPNGAAAVPIAFGFHPYLKLPESDRSQWLVSLPARRHLATDQQGIPTGVAERQVAESFRLADLAFDDGYDGLASGARFAAAGRERTIAITLEHGYPAAQVFTPPGAQFICFEPMTAPTNALRSGMGLRCVPPGDSFTAVFRIDVAANE